MSNSSVDKLAVTPEDIAEIQADIPEMAQEFGWSKQDTWIHELGKRMTKWDAAKIGKHSLRAELMRRLDPSYYFEDQQHRIFIGGENFGELWYPSPISLVHASKRIQSEVLSSEYFRVLVWGNCYGEGSVQLLGNKGDGYKTLLFEYLNPSEAANFVAKICDLPFEEVKGKLTGEIPFSDDHRGYVAMSSARVFPINLNRLLPQD